MAERIKLYMMMKRYEAEALSYSGSHRIVALFGMQMCFAALDGKLNRFNQAPPDGYHSVAEGWPDPMKFAPPDLGAN